LRSSCDGHAFYWRSCTAFSSWPLYAQVEVGSGARVLPLASFRGTTRPVLLAGSKAYLQKAQAAAEPYRQARTPTAAVVCMRTVHAKS
jgi:hypothetical protein